MRNIHTLNMSRHILNTVCIIIGLLTCMALTNNRVQGKLVSEDCVPGKSVQLNCTEHTWIHIQSVELLQTDNANATIESALCDSSQCESPQIMRDVVSRCTGMTECTFYLTNDTCGENQTASLTSYKVNYECIAATSASSLCSSTTVLADYLVNVQFPDVSSNINASNCDCQLTSTEPANITVLFSDCQNPLHISIAGVNYELCNGTPLWNVLWESASSLKRNATFISSGKFWLKIQDPTSLRIDCSLTTSTPVTDSSTITPSSTTTAIQAPINPQHKLTPTEKKFKNAGWLFGIAFGSAIVVFFLAIGLIYLRRRHIDHRKKRREEQTSQRFEKFDNILETDDEQDTGPSVMRESKISPNKLSGPGGKYQANDETLHLQPQTRTQYESVSLQAFNNITFLEDLETPNVEIRPRSVSVADLPSSATSPGMKVHFEDTIFENKEWRRSEGAFKNKRPTVKRASATKTDSFDSIS